MKIYTLNILNSIKSIFSKEVVKIDVAPQNKERAASVKLTTIPFFQSAVYTTANNVVLYSMYQNIEQVKAIINRLTEKYSNIPYIIKNKKTLKVIDNHYINKIVTNDLLKQIFLEYLIIGNSYSNFVKSSKNYVESIKNLPSIFTIANVSNITDLYIAKIETYEIIVGTRRKFNESEIFHFKNNILQNSSTFNPYGESNLQTAIKSLTILKAVYDSLITIFSKRGAVGILSPKVNSFVETDVEAKVNDFYNNHGFGDDKKSILFASSPIDYTRLVMPISEMQPVQIKDSEFLELCRLFNIDSTLLNDKNSSTYNNFKTATENFINDNLKPFLTNFYKQLSEKLGTDFILEPDFTEINESMKDIKLFNEVYNLMYSQGVCDANEWRTINNLENKSEYGQRKQSPI